MRAGGKFGEDHLLAPILVFGYEELDAIQPPPAPTALQRGYDFRRHAMRLGKRAGRHRGGLPAFAVVAAFLPVADGRAERNAVFMPHSQQGDFIVEGDELFADHPRPIAPHIADGVIPRGLQRCGIIDLALALAGR